MTNSSEIVLGIDFGQTIESKDASGKKVENSDALRVIKRCVEECKKVYVVSKVNEYQRMEVIEWIYDNNFHEITGLPKENVIFCREREDKGPIAKKLGINLFIDDRPEVMVYMSKNVYPVLFKPSSEEVKKFNQQNVHQVNTWGEIENLIFNV